MPAIKAKTDSNMNLVAFSWDEYFKDSEDKPAPKACFKQAEIPPENKFKPGLKLESRDPRNDMSYCIATVICTCGPRLCLRLDGSDNRNDFWDLVDSDNIHPWGWCEGVGEQLVPPLGFAKNASYYPVFLSKLQQESSHLQAPPSCFQEPPPCPPRNMFEVGMKLEAIDRKNPQLIGPATIGDLVGDKVLVQFDGWRGAFDYWCRYDCRDIFPVGWCSASGHLLQPPGTKGNSLRGRGSGMCKSTSVSPNVPVHIDTQNHIPTGTPSPGSARSATSSKRSPNLPKHAVSSTTSLSPTDHQSALLAKAYVNQTCYCGPQLNRTSIIRLPLHYGPYPIQRTLRKVVQAIVDSASNVPLVFNSFNAGASSSAISVKISGKMMSRTLPLVTTESAFLSYMSDFLESIECCTNLITLSPLQKTCDKCSRANPGELKRSASECLTSPKRLKSRTGSTSGKARTRRSESLVPLPTHSHAHNSNTDDSSTHPFTNGELNGSSDPPEAWTVQDVMHYVRTKDPSLAKYSHLILSNEIDGRAFLLMTSDVAIKYLDMKVGPALKFCSLVDELRMVRY